jgi:uncharacterized protein with von Willebrand factor type A (vWA) domain
VDDVAALRRIERELQEQGYLVRDSRGRLELSPRAVRRVGATALRRVFAKLEAGGRGAHDVQDAGAAGETTGASRAWLFGDEQPLDVVRTVRNAVLRTGRTTAGSGCTSTTSRSSRPSDAPALPSRCWSTCRSRWSCAAAGARQADALALHSLVTTKYPQDAIEIIGFSDYAQVLTPEKLAGLEAQRVQGTNLQHALVLAGATSASTRTPSRSCWWSPTASRRRT